MSRGCRKIEPISARCHAGVTKCRFKIMSRDVETLPGCREMPRAMSQDVTHVTPSSLHKARCLVLSGSLLRTVLRLRYLHMEVGLLQAQVGSAILQIEDLLRIPWSHGIWSRISLNCCLSGQRRVRTSHPSKKLKSCFESSLNQHVPLRVSVF